MMPPSSMPTQDLPNKDLPTQDAAADLPNKDAPPAEGAPERARAHVPTTARHPFLASPGSEPIGTFHLSAPAPTTASVAAPLDVVVPVPGWMHDAFVSLLCAHLPREVRSYLEASDGYRLELALQATQAHGCDEGAAYLLERTGDVRGSMRRMHNCH